METWLPGVIWIKTLGENSPGILAGSAKPILVPRSKPIEESCKVARAEVPRNSRLVIS
jgi:hypothetical protein